MTRRIGAGAVQARMARLAAGLAVAAAALGLNAEAQAACNVKGQFCGHPAWASNAFAGRFDRVPESTLEPEKHYQAERASRHVEKIIRVEKVVRKAPPAPALVKFADGFGRQFDPASKVWFDGKSQCWAGSEQFTYRSGDWFYGKKEWADANGTWKVASGRGPELVSCESVPSFAAKAEAVAAKTTTTRAGQLEQTESAASTSKSAASQPAKVTASPAVAQGPAKSAAPAECKKYFPSVGLMLPVPCTE
jgi:hypothetical protein